VTDWRRAADRAVTAALETHRSGGPTPKQSTEQAEIDRLRARNARLEAELESLSGSLCKRRSLVACWVV
jgi:hypothetical protein